MSYYSMQNQVPSQQASKPTRHSPKGIGGRYIIQLHEKRDLLQLIAQFYHRPLFNLQPLREYGIQILLKILYK